MTKPQCFWFGNLITELFIPPGMIQSFIFISLTFCQPHIIKRAAALCGLGLRGQYVSEWGQETLFQVLPYHPITPMPEANWPINNIMIIFTPPQNLFQVLEHTVSSPLLVSLSPLVPVSDPHFIQYFAAGDGGRRDNRGAHVGYFNKRVLHKTKL